MSADWSSFSPGKKAALRVTSREKIRTIAFGGTPGRDVWPRVGPSDLADHTIIIAVDLFFWDSTLSNVEPSIQTLRAVADAAKERGVPLVLGEIPELLPGRQPHRSRLNREISETVRKNPLFRLMPFDRIHREVLRTGKIRYRGEDYSIFELVPDGLHLSEVAGDYLADEFEALFRPPAR